MGQRLLSASGGRPGAPDGRRPKLTLDDFHTEDGVMAECLNRARVAAATDLPLLILGESGTGKTLLAQAIHNSSARAGRPFVAFNAAALSDSLLDSQLFGHERGAFTGAHNGVRGRFEQADGGTLFIDEIADMSPPAQAKILRAVEYGEFERLGSETLQVADVRLISATHRPLATSGSAGGFRRDLLFRISGIVLTIPPLRERPRDLPLLMAAEIAAASRTQGKSIAGLDAGAAERLFAHPWPGNLRELSRVIHAAVALTSGEVIGERALLLDAAPSSADAAGAGAAASGEILTLAEVERRHVRGVLQQVGGNKRRAARALDVSRATLDRMLARAGRSRSEA